MILVDKPYLSEFLKATSLNDGIPIVDTRAAREFGLRAFEKLIPEEEAIARFRADPQPRLYTNSENAIGWIAANLAFSDLPAKIEIFKNKARFRELTRPLLPDFYFREVAYADLDDIRIEEPVPSKGTDSSSSSSTPQPFIKVEEPVPSKGTGSSARSSVPLPFIIKPNVGFFSLGVHKVSSREEWTRVKAQIQSEVARKDDLYPAEVLDTTSFIIEAVIEGEEFAFDAYFDENGAAVIVGIYKHLFSSENDVSDRIYITSKAIIEANLDEFTAWLNQVGALAGMHDFPVHVEVRRTAAGQIAPIEVNPLRFGGWCTTADMTAAAYGFNPYVYYFENQKPAWDEILSTRAGKLYSMIVLDNSSGYAGEDIEAFDYEALLASFEHPLELRKIDYRKYPVFGFLFVETRDENFAELERILKSDLREFIKLECHTK